MAGGLGHDGATIALWRRGQSAPAGEESIVAIHRFQNPSTMPPTRGYTHVVDTTSPCRTIYISGQLGMAADATVSAGAGAFRAQSTQCFENWKHALAAVGASFEHVVKVTCYFVDMAH